MLEPQEEARWRRSIAAMVKAAGADDPETFAALARMLSDAAGDGMRQAAAQLRAAQPNGATGYSWADLGQALGVTRSAAQQRYGQRGE